MLRYLLYLLLVPGRFVLFPLYWLSGFVPRRRDRWVFGSWGGHRFADNAAAFFLFCQDRVGQDIELIWISRDRSIVKRLRDHGLTAHWTWSPRGIVACLTARIHLFDCFAKDINFWFSRGAIKINLWSGVPLKVFERDIDNPRSRYYRLFHGFLLERWALAMMMPSHVDRPDLIIATSHECGVITRRAFDLPAGRVVVTGFPRNDVLFDRSRSVADLNCPLPPVFTDAVAADRKVLLYLPTFRDSGKAYMDIDWAELDQVMADTGATLFFKTHPMDRLKVEVDCRHIHKLPQPIDVYDLLPDVDVLISDYSSIIFDFMLVDRPIIYYTPDLNSFLESSRSLLFHPRDVAVGPMCESFQALKDELAGLELDHRPVSDDRREQVYSRMHRHRDGDASLRLLGVINRRYCGGELGVDECGNVEAI